MANRAKPCHSATPGPNQPTAFYQLHSLLGTLRQLARHEDELCSLLGELERRGKLGAATGRELERLLHDLPLETLRQEVDALWQTLEERAA